MITEMENNPDLYDIDIFENLLKSELETVKMDVGIMVM